MSPPGPMVAPPMDVTLGGPVEMVASDVADIVNAGSKIDLSLNAAK